MLNLKNYVLQFKIEPGSARNSGLGDKPMQQKIIQFLKKQQDKKKNLDSIPIANENKKKK